MQRKILIIIVLILNYSNIKAADTQMTREQKWQHQQQRINFAIRVQQALQLQDDASSIPPQQINSLSDPDNTYDVLISGMRHSNQTIDLPNLKHVKMGLLNNAYSNLDLHIPYFVEKLTLHIKDLKFTNINIYACHNPIIDRSNFENIGYSNISNVMHPIRRYTYHIALATSAIALLYCFTKK